MLYPRYLLAVICVLSGVVFSGGEARALWLQDISLHAQLVSGAEMKLIRVTKTSCIAALDVPTTQISYDELDIATYTTLASGALAYPGGTTEDGTTVICSTSPDMRVGEYYVVFLASGKGQLLFESMSALPVVSSGPIDALGPTLLPDSLVLLTRAHGAVFNPKTGGVELLSTGPGLTPNFKAASVALTITELTMALLSFTATTDFEVSE